MNMGGCSIKLGKYCCVGCDIGTVVFILVTLYLEMAL